MRVRQHDLGVLQQVLVPGFLAGLGAAVARGVLFDHGVVDGPRLRFLVRDGLDGAAGVPLGGVAGERLRLVSNLGGAAQDYDEPGHEHE